VFNFEQEFRHRVIDYFVGDYLKGAPQSCVACNTWLKFDLLLERALGLEADFVATGHYASVVYDEASQRYAIRRGVDRRKDQSYFLFELRQEQLARMLLPLGSFRRMKYASRPALWPGGGPEGRKPGDLFHSGS
jgi:tRNA-specific 2-thiouridylase